MNDLFIQWGSFFFRTRNVLFPVFIIGILLLCPPVAINDALSFYGLFIGWLLIAIGQSLRVLTIGLAYIIRGGRNRCVYAEKLVTEGVFAHCRNPLYVGNILIVSGFFCVSGNLVGIVIGSIGFMALYHLIVYSEEAFLTNKFGQDYHNFCMKVPRWLPKLTGLSKTMAQYEFDWPAVAVKEYGTLMTSLLTPLILIAWKLHLVNKAEEHQFLLIGAAVLILSAYGLIRFLKKSGRLQAMR